MRPPIETGAIPPPPTQPPGVGWEHFEHEADIGVRGHGISMPQAFAQAALALTAVVADPASIEPHQSVNVCCRAPDAELLLADWLNTVIFEMSTRHMLFNAFDVDIDGSQLRATLWGEAVNQRRHSPAVEVKGATFAELAVTRDDHGVWHAQCVVDV